MAAPVDTSTPFKGAFLLEDGEALVAAIKSGDWVAGGFAVFSGAMDTVAAVIDPLGSLIASGLGWLMEHLEPLKGWLNGLTGDAGQVAGFSQTWTNVGAQLRQSASDLSVVLGDLDAADGEAVRAYLAFQEDVVAHLHAAGSWADGVATGMQMASTIVQVVHDLVRDALAQLVGSLISYASELILTVGLAAPLVIEQAATRVSALVTRFSTKIPQLVDALRQLGKLVDDLKALFTRFDDIADKALRRGGGEERGVNAQQSPSGALATSPPNGKVPLTDEQMAEIVAMPKGTRPDPASYLPAKYIADHLANFDGGSTRFMLKDNLIDYGIGQRDGTTFVMPTQHVDDLMKAAGDDSRVLEQMLGLPRGYLKQGVVRVDIPADRAAGLRMPSGNEAGANELWIPGGKLPTGLPEAVIDGSTVDPGGIHVELMD
ncbi:hypothetical protein CW368_12180 [Actinomycetales bacterium SN12]|nr:hypothetical protein CW368_12180 [Actinomycetales bacterium SN12]